MRESLESTLDPRPRWYSGELSGGYQAEITRMIDAVAPTGWTTENERAFVWAVTRLALGSPDVVEQMVSHVNAIINGAAWLTQKKSAENIDAPQTIRRFREEPKARQGRAITGGAFDRVGE